MTTVMIYLAFSVVLLAIALVCTCARNLIALISMGPLWLLVTFLGLYLAPLIILHSLALMVLDFGGWMFAARPRIVFSLSLGVTVCLYGWFLYLAIDIAHERAQFWAENRPRSLEHRLEYEQSVSLLPTPEPPASAPDADSDRYWELADHGLEELANADTRADTWRQSSLSSLETMHYDNVLDFINSEGAGFRRRLLPHGRFIYLPPLPYLPQQEPPSQDLATFDRSPGDAISGNNGTGVEPAPAKEPLPREAGSFLQGPPPQPPTTDQLQTLHLAGTIDFVNAPGFGYVPSRESAEAPFGDLSRVMGFQPHAFRKPPGIRRAPGTQATWLIDRLELVSLLKHSEPAVYISKHLPRMDELREATTRPLSDFESQALPKLQAGEDLVVDPQPGEIRMLGAVRAVRRCLDCHRAREGDLLGAFTYRLLSTPQPAAKTVNDPAL